MTLPAEGTVLAGKYRIDRYIGEGGMSAVARCRHLDREADVALKFLLPGDANRPEAVARFRREAVAASRLDTDHVARIYDVGEAEGITYLVMELLEGGDLDRLLAHQRVVDLPRAVHIVLQLLRALAVAHKAGVTHRDVKPSNVWLCARDGETDFVKLLDFGISRLAEPGGGADHRLTLADTSMGTPLYMAPEQARDASSADGRSDLYSVGAMLFEMLTGKPPLDGETTNALLFRVFQEVPPRLDAVRPDLPAALADIVARCLAKDPAERPQDAETLAAALGAFADDRSRRVLSAFDRAPSSLTPLPSSRHGTLALARTLTASAMVVSPPPVPRRKRAALLVVGALAAASALAAGVLLRPRAATTETDSAHAAAPPLASVLPAASALPEDVSPARVVAKEEPPAQTATPAPSAARSSAPNPNAGGGGRKRPPASAFDLGILR